LERRLKWVIAVDLENGSLVPRFGRCVCDREVKLFARLNRDRGGRPSYLESIAAADADDAGYMQIGRADVEQLQETCVATPDADGAEGKVSINR
jgi:hypothetical protein